MYMIKLTRTLTYQSVRRSLGAATAAALAAVTLTGGPAAAGTRAQVALDSFFGDRGEVVTDFAGWYDRGNAVAAIGDGVIVAGDASAPGTSLVTGDFGYDAGVRGLAKLPHDRLVAAGSVENQDQAGAEDFAVAGYRLH
ncbi:hypothetical protein Adu01nite_90950 [Paractinoplanes durhamensis]|uniref:Uncharacterized protein n=2 Tax=Paractinoplanes durhamensis TaxID=113563 RepID=A0ABQ3ZD61_9ACTN|nr:hypothetical protein Adu01nite_90950 [Actinoplanes durhamensis]